MNSKGDEVFDSLTKYVGMRPPSPSPALLALVDKQYNVEIRDQDAG